MRHDLTEVRVRVAGFIVTVTQAVGGFLRIWHVSQVPRSCFDGVLVKIHDRRASSCVHLGQHYNPERRGARALSALSD
jgi:hypothetical protein